jgi:hypothetical protein
MGVETTPWTLPQHCYAEGCTTVGEAEGINLIPVGWFAVAERLPSGRGETLRTFVFCPAHKPNTPPIKHPWPRRTPDGK